MKLRKVVDKGDPKNKEIAYKFFVEEKGYSPEVALGIVGNLMQESHANLVTTVEGFDGTGSLGIEQWLGHRKKKLKEVRPNDFDTLRRQLEFIDWELNNTEKRAASKLKNAKSVEDAALTFSKYYERPHKDYAHNDKRVNYAKNLGKQLGVSVGKPNVSSSIKQPPLSTPPINPDYAALPEAQKAEIKEEAGISEAQMRNILEQERSATEKRFLQAFQEQNAQEQPKYTPQPLQEDLSHLYNYIKLED